MDPEEQELQNDYRYRHYEGVIEKALRNFESSSEWADLISSLGKLNKVSLSKMLTLFLISLLFCDFKLHFLLLFFSFRLFSFH